MGRKPASQQEVDQYLELRRLGHNNRQASLRTGRTAGWGSVVWKKHLAGETTARVVLPDDQPTWRPLAFDELHSVARDCLTDFGRFRARFFGRRSTPWQEHAANVVKDRLETPHKEFGVVNCPPGSGKPVDVDALVLMGDGSRKRLGDIRVGDWVISHRGRPCRVQAVHEQGVLPVVEVRNDRGQQVLAAGDHPFLTVDGFAEAKNLGGSQAVTLGDLADVEPAVGSYRPAHEFRMAGYFVGDGSCSAGNCAVTNADPAIITDIEWIAAEMGWAETTTQPRNGSVSVTRFRGGARDWLKAGGLWGGTSATKRPPSWVFAAPADRIASFVGAYWACDGWVSGSTIEAATINPDLAADLQHLLGRLGIQSKVVCQTRKNDYRVWRVTILERSRFAEIVPVVGDKSLRLASLVGWSRSGAGGKPGPQGFVTWTDDGQTRECRCLTVEEDSTFIVNDFVVHNSTLFTHDIPAWLTVRNRAMRGFLGTATAKLSEGYVRRLRQAFEATTPPQADPSELGRGLAYQAQATLQHDFGQFKPDDRMIPWSSRQFTILQLDSELNPTASSDEKESTWTGFGQDSGFLGWRVNFIVWDDLVTLDILKNLDRIERQREWWVNVAETRLEPNGLLLLQGQRLGVEDLYRFCLDMRDAPDDILELEDAGDDDRKYFHIVYKAHYEEFCTADAETAEGHVDERRVPWSHARRGDRFFDPDKPETSGCLLDPLRLPWRELRRIERQPLANYRVVYQQEDVDPSDVLVPRFWIDGGNHNGEEFPGCWDVDREPATIPRTQGFWHSVVTVDPSPKRYWAIQWWLYVEQSHVDRRMGQRYLLDQVWKPMGANDLLDWNTTKACWTGLLEDWKERAKRLGRPIRWLIIEVNAQQRFLSQYEWFRKWCSANSISSRPHYTGKNKTDPEFGVTTIGTHYRYGRVRLPGTPEGRRVSAPLVDQVTRYGTESAIYDDAVMAHWFFEFQLQHLPRREKRRISTYNDMPSWAKVAV